MDLKYIQFPDYQNDYHPEKSKSIMHMEHQTVKQKIQISILPQKIYLELQASQ